MRYQYDGYGWYVGTIDTDEALPFTSSIAPQEQDIFGPEGSDIRPNYVGNGWQWMPFESVKSQNTEPPIVVNPTTWLIDIGPFYDRFGSAKIAVLTNTDPGLRAILADINIRKWIDLQRPDVAQGLQYVKAVVPSVTDELIHSILTNPVTEAENLALRKLYFNG